MKTILSAILVVVFAVTGLAQEKYDKPIDRATCDTISLARSLMGTWMDVNDSGHQLELINIDANKTETGKLEFSENGVPLCSDCPYTSAGFWCIRTGRTGYQNDTVCNYFYIGLADSRGIFSFKASSLTENNQRLKICYSDGYIVDYKRKP